MCFDQRSPRAAAAFERNKAAIWFTIVHAANSIGLVEEACFKVPLLLQYLRHDECFLERLRGLAACERLFGAQ